jgi:hypothetical protein
MKSKPSAARRNRHKNGSAPIVLAPTAIGVFALHQTTRVFFDAVPRQWNPVSVFWSLAEIVANYAQRERSGSKCDSAELGTRLASTPRNHNMILTKVGHARPKK